MSNGGMQTQWTSRAIRRTNDVSISEYLVKTEFFLLQCEDFEYFKSSHNR